MSFIQSKKKIRVQILVEKANRKFYFKVGLKNSIFLEFSGDLSEHSTCTRRLDILLAIYRLSTKIYSPLKVMVH